MNIPVSANRRQFLRARLRVGLVVGFHIPLAERARRRGLCRRVRAQRLHPHRARQHRHGHLQAHRVRAGAVHRHRHHPRRRARRRLGADRVESAPADASKYANSPSVVQGTGGSTAMANSWEQLRNAGAEARARLIAAAAKEWGVDAGCDHHREGCRQRPVRQDRRRSASLPASRSRSRCPARSSRRIRAPGS